MVNRAIITFIYIATWLTAVIVTVLYTNYVSVIEHNRKESEQYFLGISQRYNIIRQILDHNQWRPSLEAYPTGSILTYV